MILRSIVVVVEVVVCFVIKSYVRRASKFTNFKQDMAESYEGLGISLQKCAQT